MVFEPFWDLFSAKFDKTISRGRYASKTKTRGRNSIRSSAVFAVEGGMTRKLPGRTAATIDYSF